MKHFVLLLTLSLALCRCQPLPAQPADPSLNLNPNLNLNLSRHRPALPTPPEPLDLQVTNVVVVPRFVYYALTDSGSVSCMGRLTLAQFNHEWAPKATNYVAFFRQRTREELECVWLRPQYTVVNLGGTGDGGMVTNKLAVPQLTTDH